MVNEESGAPGLSGCRYLEVWLLCVKAWLFFFLPHFFSFLQSKGAVVCIDLFFHYSSAQAFCWDSFCQNSAALSSIWISSCFLFSSPGERVGGRGRDECWEVG